MHGFPDNSSRPRTSATPLSQPAAAGFWSRHIGYWQCHPASSPRTLLPRHCKSSTGRIWSAQSCFSLLLHKYASHKRRVIGTPQTVWSPVKYMLRGGLECHFRRAQCRKYGQAIRKGSHRKWTTKPASTPLEKDTTQHCRRGLRICASPRGPSPTPAQCCLGLNISYHSRLNASRLPVARGYVSRIPVLN